MVPSPRKAGPVTRSSPMKRVQSSPASFSPRKLQQLSPWTNPRERNATFKSRRKRKLEMEKENQNMKKPCNILTPIVESPTKKAKKLNPFRRSPRKRLTSKPKSPRKELRQPRLLALYAETPDIPDDSNSRLFSSLDLHDKEFDHGVLPTDFSSLLREELKPLDPVPKPLASNNTTPLPEQKLPKRTSTETESLPIDLRLGNRMRISSKEPFPWMGNNSQGVFPLRSITKSNGVQMASVGRPLQSVDHLPNFKIDDSVGVVSEIVAATHFWIFPVVPWISSFPRRFDGRRLSQSVKDVKEAFDLSSLRTWGNIMCEKLRSDWKASFDQTFNSWKAGACSYFYLCCSNFTIVFLRLRKSEETAEVSSSFSETLAAFPQSKAEFRVFITPTTGGFRKILTEEEIPFECPLRAAKSRRSSKDSNARDSMESSRPPSECSTLGGIEVTQSQPPFLFMDSSSSRDSIGKLPEDLTAKESDSDGELNSSNEFGFLTDCGISPEKSMRWFSRSLSERPRRSHSASPSLHEEQAKSLISIMGFPAIQSFFNFLTGNLQKLLMSPSGVHAGLPPTIIAPCPFLGGTLSSLKPKGTYNPNSESSRYVLEFEGPVMPHAVFRISKILEKAGCEKWSLNLNAQSSFPGLNASLRNLYRENIGPGGNAEDIGAMLEQNPDVFADVSGGKMEELLLQGFCADLKDANYSPFNHYCWKFAPS